METNHQNGNESIFKQQEKITLPDKEIDDMRDNQYAGIYAELVPLIGKQATIKIWNNFKGISATFPQSLYSKEYFQEYIRSHEKNMKAADMARELGLSERRVRQIIKELKA